MKIPKAIVNHPKVNKCYEGESLGFDGYRYHVELKKGEAFTGGRMEGGTIGNFNSVKDFMRAMKPIKERERL